MAPKAIAINICTSKAVTDKRHLIRLAAILEVIAGQSGVLTKARKSLHAFRLREGMEIGIKVTIANNK